MATYCRHAGLKMSPPHTDTLCLFVVFGIHDSELIHSLVLIHLFALHDYMSHPLGILCVDVCAQEVLQCATDSSTLSVVHTLLCSSHDPFYFHQYFYQFCTSVTNGNVRAEAGRD